MKWLVQCLHLSLYIFTRPINLLFLIHNWSFTSRKHQLCLKCYSCFWLSFKLYKTDHLFKLEEFLVFLLLFLWPDSPDHFWLASRLQNLWGLSARKPGGVPGCERGERLSDCSLWTHDLQVRETPHSFYFKELPSRILSFSACSFEFPSVETRPTWRSSPSLCSECVRASFPTPTTTSRPGTHTSALWASRPWVSLIWAGSFTSRHQRTLAVFSSYTNTLKSLKFYLQELKQTSE